MKKNILLIASAILILAGCNKSDEDSDNTTLSMGNQYVYDVYYSFKTGVVKKVDKTIWDIAFSVPLHTATIIINEGAGVKLYCAGDTSAWNTIDTSMIKNLKPRYNNKSDWMKGAFNHNSVTPFNFGWGTYNMGSHNVYGDSIYFIRLTDGSYKRLFIRERVGASDTYLIRLADANGSNEAVLNLPPASAGPNKNFIHCSLVNQNLVVVEPDKANWDLLFTVYYENLSAGSSYVDYPVVGVLANQGIKLQKVTGIAPESALLSDVKGEFSSQADLIGWGWKVNDAATYEYSIVPNTSYFVKLSDSTIYKIYFTGFDGSATGDVTFKAWLAE